MIRQTDDSTEEHSSETANQAPTQPPPPRPGSDLAGLVRLVARLRHPGDGCPWDRQQGVADVRAYLLEECHELAAALDRLPAGDGAAWDEVREEAGDVLFQLAFLLRLAQEEERFEPGDVLDANHAKMVSRHPHVFGDATAEDTAAVARLWEEGKKRRRAAGESLLEGVPETLPALLGAYRIGQKVAAVGFDWPDPRRVLDKVDEELAELRQALEGHPATAGETEPREMEAREMEAGDFEAGERNGDGDDAVAEEMGDLLFTVAQLARQLGVDPEAALAAGNAKFRRRFRQLEAALEDQGLEPGEVDLETLEALWRRVKEREG